MIEANGIKPMGAVCVSAFTSGDYHYQPTSLKSYVGISVLIVILVLLKLGLIFSTEAGHEKIQPIQNK